MIEDDGLAARDDTVDREAAYGPGNLGDPVCPITAIAGHEADPLSLLVGQDAIPVVTPSVCPVRRVAGFGAQTGERGVVQPI